MPGFETHYIFGVKCYKSAKESNIKRIIYDNKRSYSIGLQGPDILFYYLPSYIVHKNNIGSQAHSVRIQVLFEGFIAGINFFKDKKDREIAISYVSGLLNHYILDSTCHPYIYYATNYISKTNEYYGRHIDFETKINIVMLNKYKNVNPSKFYQADVIALTRYETFIIARLLKYAYNFAFPEYKFTFNMARHALNYFNKCIKLLNDNTGFKKKFLGFFEKSILGYNYFSRIIALDSININSDIMNIKHKTWLNPWDINYSSNESFYDLMIKSQAKFIDILNALEHYLNTDDIKDFEVLINLIGNNSYHSGLDSNKEGIIK